MGLDLRILPEYTERNHDFSHDILSFHRDEILDLIGDKEKECGHEILEPFNSYTSRDDKYEESHYGETFKTPYGNVIKFLYARDLKECLKNVNIENMYWRNKAIITYIRQLPDNLRIYLYWC